MSKVASKELSSRDGRILRVDVGSNMIKAETAPDEYRLLGGRGLTAKIMLNEVDPSCDPLGPGNKIIFAPGLLGGTGAPCAARVSVGSKSPLTSGIKESNGGGMAALKLSKLGIKAVIIENQPKNDEWRSLLITNEGIEFVEADQVIGKGNYDTAKFYRDRYGSEKTVVSIGPAGENMFLNSTLAITDRDGNPARHCARGGLGAVLGSKKIKALILDDSNAKGPGIAHPERFREISVAWSRELVKSKAHLTQYGTPYLVGIVNEIGGLPTHNFRAGKFDKANNICGERLREVVTKRSGKASHSCYPGCPIRCSNVYRDDEGNYVTSALEYETIGLLGSNLGIGDLDTIARLDRFCDDIGMDTIELGAAIGVLMESGHIPFGQSEGVFHVLDEIRGKTVLGRLIGQGAAITGKVLGVRRVPVVKGQGISSWDPRSFKATGITYITSPQGADHTAGNCPPGRVGFRPQRSSLEGEADLSLDIQIMSAVCDLVGICLFVGANAATMKRFADLINARFESNFTNIDVIEMGKSVIKTETEFNRKAKLYDVIDRLPNFFYSEPLPPYNLIFDIPKGKIIDSHDDLYPSMKSTNLKRNL